MGTGIQPSLAAKASRPGRGRHRGIQKPSRHAGIAREQGIAQKISITCPWARRGTRPSALQDQRYASTYIFGAVCLQDCKGTALVLPFCYTAGMNLHLAEISITVSPGKHAMLLLDQAGWHLSADVAVPGTITLLPLPPSCTELNVMENVWQFMRDNWLSNRAFCDHDDIVAHCCHYWKCLVDQPWRIMSIGLRDWAHGL
jgi:hypothetical protein